MELHLRAIAAVAMLICTPVSHAALISYAATNIAESHWRYDYSITNDTLGQPLQEFTIYFDRALFADLQLANAPLSWDSLAIQPDDFLESDGFFDALALDAGLSLGGTLSGFSVLFEFRGTGMPGSQRFEVLNPLTFEVLEVGFTQPQTPPATVPEPMTLVLLMMSLLGLPFARRRSLTP